MKFLMVKKLALFFFFWMIHMVTQTGENFPTSLVILKPKLDKGSSRKLYHWPIFQTYRKKEKKILTYKYIYSHSTHLNPECMGTLTLQSLLIQFFTLIDQRIKNCL